VKTDKSPTSLTKVKNEWSYIRTPHICLRGMDREYFTLTFTITLQANLLRLCKVIDPCIVHIFLFFFHKDFLLLVIDRGVIVHLMAVAVQGTHK
jgi:hypothetical protein